MAQDPSLTSGESKPGARAETDGSGACRRPVSQPTDPERGCRRDVAGLDLDPNVEIAEAVIFALSCLHEQAEAHGQTRRRHESARSRKESSTSWVTPFGRMYSARTAGTPSRRHSEEASEHGKNHKAGGQGEPHAARMGELRDMLALPVLARFSRPGRRRMGWKLSAWLRHLSDPPDRVPAIATGAV